MPNTGHPHQQPSPRLHSSRADRVKSKLHLNPAMALSINLALPVLLAMMLLATVPALCSANQESAELVHPGGRFLESVDTGAHARKLLNGNLCGSGLAPNFSCKIIMPFAVNATCCGQLCYDVGILPTRCGSCNTVCAFGQLCCTGKCTNTLTDKNNCGLCGKKCPGNLPCRFGLCGYGF